MSGACLIFIHPSDELYGADRMLLEQLEAVPDDIRVEVWLPTDLPHSPANRLCDVLQGRGVTVRHLELPILRRAYRTPQGLLALVGRGRRLVRALRASRPDMVYCTTSATFLAAPMARLARVPMVLGHVQEMWSGSDRVSLLLPALACHRLLAISEPVRRSLPEPAARRVRVVPNSTPGPSQVSELAGRRGALNFVVASRWNGWKGHRTLLQAWDRLEHPGHLTVLGGPPASGQVVDVRALVAELRHPGSVTVVGEVADPAPYLDAADVVVMPSDDPEPFGLVAIEAFAHGRPVVASHGGGLADIVDDGCNGWLFPPRDAAALARVLEGLDRPSVETAGRQAWDDYLLLYTSQAYAERWRDAVQFFEVTEHSARYRT